MTQLELRYPIAGCNNKDLRDMSKHAINYNEIINYLVEEINKGNLCLVFEGNKDTYYLIKHKSEVILKRVSSGYGMGTYFMTVFDKGITSKDVEYYLKDNFIIDFV